jgi:hypothetical protein
MGLLDRGCVYIASALRHKLQAICLPSLPGLSVDRLKVNYFHALESWAVTVGLIYKAIEAGLVLLTVKDYALSFGDAWGVHGVLLFVGLTNVQLFLFRSTLRATLFPVGP